MKILIEATYKDGEIVDEVYAEIPVGLVAIKWGLIPRDSLGGQDEIQATKTA